MQPQKSKLNLADTAALTGGLGLGSIILFFLSLFYGISDGSLNFLLLLVIGIVLAFIGTIAGVLALRRHTPPKGKAVIGITTGLLGLGVSAFILIYAAIWVSAFSTGS